MRHRELGLTDAEYALIVERLGREPGDVELAMLSLMWSEHCAYKHSKKLLRRLPTEGPHVLLGPGENAGAVDVGGGLAVAFKVESHNHPSAVEPFQGAATGVGGILRDVFAVGARPIAVLDSLRFGEPATSRALALPARAGGRRDRPLRQLDRRAHGRGRDLLRAALRAELPDQRDVPRPRAARAADPQRGGRSGQRARAARGADRARRHRRRVGAGQRRARRGRRRQAARRSRSATRSPRRSCSSAASSCSTASCSSRLQDLGAAGLTSSSAGDGQQGRGRSRHRRRTGAAARARHGVLRDHGLRVPGADAVRRRARAASSRCSPSASAGRPSPRRSARSPPVRTCGCSRDGTLVAEMPVPALVDDCPLYDLEPAPPAQPLYEAPPPHLSGGESPRELLLALLRQRQHRLPPPGVRAVRPASCSRAPYAGLRRPTRPCWPWPTGERSPSRSTATAAAWPCDPRAVRPRPSTSARPTWPASGPSRSGSPTA